VHIAMSAPSYASKISPLSTAPPLPSTITYIARIGLVILIFCFGASFVLLLWKSLPEGQSYTFSIPPQSLDDAKQLGQYIGQYTHSHYYRVIAVFLSAYIWLQAFAIPGSIFLSILSGALFKFPVALFLVCVAASVGASSANIISSYIGRELVEHYLHKHLGLWRERVLKHKENLFNWMIFLRITPMVPNWFVNITCPLLHVPLRTFFLGTFFGVGIPSVLFVRMGFTLQELSSSQLPTSSILILIMLSIVSLIPVIYKDYFKRHIE